MSNEDNEELALDEAAEDNELQKEQDKEHEEDI